MEHQGSLAHRFVSPRAGGFGDRQALTFPPVVQDTVQLSLAKTATGNLQVDIYGLHHGHVRFMVRLPYIVTDAIDVRVVWSASDVRLFVDDQQFDQGRVRPRSL